MAKEKIKNKISVDLIARTYKVTDGKFEIYATIDKNNKLTFKNNKGQDFVFIHSKPDVVRAITELMNEAESRIK